MKKLRKKILVLTSTFPRWKNDSTPPFVYELEKRLVNDFDITILAPHYNGAKKYEEWNGLKIHRFQYFWPALSQKLCYEGGIMPNIKKNRLLYVQAISLIFFELVAAIKIKNREKIELIHAHWLLPQGIIALIINKLFKIPYIVTTHGGDIYGLQNGLIKKLKRLILKSAHKITVVSNDVQTKVNQILPDAKIEVISMGVDSMIFNKSKIDPKIRYQYNASGPLLLFVGRLVEKKGVEYLVAAMPIILKKYPSAKLLIIGSGPLDKDIYQLARQLKLNNSVIMIGPISHTKLAKYYATADIFIGPSIQLKEGDTEGFGLTFVEAAFSGTIPIGTNVGGISDILKYGDTKLIVSQRDSKAIAKAVLYVIENPLFRNRIKQKLLRLVDIYDWKNIANKYDCQYSNAL